MVAGAWQVVDLTDFSGSVRYVRGNLRVIRKSENKPIDLPLATIAMLLIGNSAAISGAVLSKLSEYDIPLLVCDWRKVPVAGAIPWREHTRIGARQQAQATLSIPRRKRAWSSIVRAKIKGQAATLSDLNLQSDANQLHKLATTVRSGDPDNREAQAARIYWSAISGSTGFIRLPGGGLDAWNASLDYTYTVLRGHGIRAITAAGLSGALGVFHHGRGNPFALVDDLIEPFRPSIDAYIFQSISIDNSLSSEIRRSLVASCDRTFNDEGQSLPTVFTSFAQNFGRYVEGDLADLPVPIWKGQVDAKERS
jgi:hypothetical protein